MSEFARKIFRQKPVLDEMSVSIYNAESDVLNEFITNRWQKWLFMIFESHLSDAACLRELGERLARLRLNRNQTQAALAHEAGVSLRTVVRLEQGESVQLTNLLRVLRALDLLGNLEALAPEPAASPLQQIRRQGRLRRRASVPRERDAGREGSGDREEADGWSWGEES